MPKTDVVLDTIDVPAKKRPKKDIPPQKEVALEHDKPHAFTANDFKQLAANEHARYMPNAKKIGHAVILKDGDNTLAYQYPIPIDNTDPAMPQLRPLLKIEEFEPFRGMTRYRAESPNGTKMYAKRFIFGELGKDDATTTIQIACFSPTNKAGNQLPFWGSTKETPVFSSVLSEKMQKDLKKELSEIKPVFKGGDIQEVQHTSVPKRDLIATRNPTQNKVMGESARDAYESFFDTMSDELNPEMKARLKRAFQADIKGGLFINSYRPEWLHLYGWSLTPIDENPQTKDNLGAGPKWANTQMMVLERIVKWFALNSPESLLTIQPKFDMLLDSDLIKHIDFNVKIQIKNKYVKLMQSIDPFLAYPMFPKASDLAQGAAITYDLLNKVKPVSKQEVIRPGMKPIEKAAESSSSSSLDFVVIKKKPSGLVSDGVMKTAKGKTEKVDAPASKVPKVTKFKAKKSIPSDQNNDDSAVQIYATSLEADYDTPWRGPKEQSCSGSGVIIENMGRKYILTNAHVVENNIFLEVILSNDRKRKYEAKYKCISYQSDLALLDIDDPEFQELAKPAEIAGLDEMVIKDQKVRVVGFPMGGAEISVSKGIVSRIEVGTYAQSGEDMLQVQVDAAINPGNSGGPVFSKGKVVGLAFQGLGMQGLSYIIPVPILRHFLKEAFSGKPYRGFPVIPYIIEQMENHDEREYYGLGNRSGVRVKRVDNLSDAFNKLKPDDILLSIDGMPISNKGTIDIEGIGTDIDFIHATHAKFIGDTVHFEVLRKHEATDKISIHQVDVILDCVPGETEKAGVVEHDKMPTYYINSALCFMPLTRNYIDGAGSDFEEIRELETGCSLADAPKKFRDEQVIVISHILKCKETTGYEKHSNSVVKEINGRVIKNMNDVLMAMDGHNSGKHKISLAGGSKIIVKNMSEPELKVLLKRHHIPSVKSEDLMSLELPSPSIKRPLTLQIPTSVRMVPVEDSPKPELAKRKTLASPSSWLDSPLAQDIKEAPKSSLGFFAKKRRIAELSEADDLSLPPLSAESMPGFKKYIASLDELEARYKDQPDFDDDEISDDDYNEADDDEEESSDESSRSHEDEDIEESDHEQQHVSSSSSKQGVSRYGMFRSLNKPSDAGVSSNMGIKFKP